MFIGHFALGFAAKRIVPRVPLPLLLTAAQLADLLWPVFVALRLEEVRIDPGNTAMTPLEFVSYPYSHSLLFLVIWGVVVGSRYSFFGSERRSFVVLAGLVVSHWVLDFVTHRPDMPLYPDSARFGLGLWNSVPGTLIVEFAMYAAGIWLYARATRPQDRTGRWAFVALCTFLVIAYLGALAGPPPSVMALWATTIVGGVVILLWSAWIDRHRLVVTHK